MKKYLLAGLGLAVLFTVLYSLYWRAHRYDESTVSEPIAPGTMTAYFAGGCFWCTESDFEKLPGVVAVISGYSGGQTINPSYEQVSSQTTGHLESVEVRYDPKLVTYEALLRYFFAHIDPTDPNGQFVDQGDSYRSAVFTQSQDEHTTVLSEIKRLTDAHVYTKSIVTEVRTFEHFYPAEAYHQDYWEKNAVRYKYYRGNSGRDRYLETACQWRTTKGISCEQSH